MIGVSYSGSGGAAGQLHPQKCELALPLPQARRPVRSFDAVYAQPATAGTDLTAELYAVQKIARRSMHSIIYLVGLVVVIMFVPSVLGLR
jgi:hypothetical protein